MSVGPAVLTMEAFVLSSVSGGTLGLPTVTSAVAGAFIEVSKSTSI